MAIILMTGISTFAFAGSTNAELNNTTSVTEETVGTGYYPIGRYRTVTHSRYLRAGNYVDITLNGDGYTNLDLYVYDGHGNLIDYRVSGSDNETLTLDIYRSETFYIKVVNRGSTVNDYSLSVISY